MDENNQRKSPPRDNLVRGVFPADLELRDAGESDTPTLYGHFSVFDTWSEISSAWEGNFLERIAPGAFKKTIRENRAGMRVLLQHGQDPQLGDKPIGAIRELREDDVGAYYEAELFKSVPDLVMEGLRAGVYGASFRFRVMREEWSDDPGVSDDNPKGLPERTIKEASVLEFGPVTWGQYPEASAGVRSLTDEWRAANAPPATSRDANVTVTLTPSPGNSGDSITSVTYGGAELTATNETNTTVTFTAAPESERTVDADATTETTDTATTAAPSHPAEEPRRDTQPATNTSEEDKKMASIDEMRARQGEVYRDLQELAGEHTGSLMDAASDTRYKALKAEWQDLDKRCDAEESRQADLAAMAGNGFVESGDDAATTRTNGGNGIPLRESGTGTYVTARSGRDKAPDDVFDLAAYHSRATSQEQLGRVYNDGAKRALDTFHFPGAKDQTAAREDLARLLDENDSRAREVEQRYVIFGSPAYRSAFWKTLTNKPLSREEQDAMQAGLALEARTITTAQTGGITVPVQIDPTILLSSAGAINPFRQISRSIQTTSHQWQGVTSTGITAQPRAEGATMADNSPTLIAPTITPERWDAFVPYSWEAGQDWGALETDMARLFADAKNVGEATKLSVGAGHASNEPQGVLVGAGTVVGTSAATAFSVTDVYALEDALPVRFQDNATWLSTTGMYQKVRQFDTAGGANLWVQLGAGNPPELIGYPAYKASTVGTAGKNLTSTARWGIFGDFSYYAIVDRIGFQVRHIDNLFSGNTAGGIAYPNGMSGVVAYWRMSAGVLASNAFRVGTIT